MLMVGLQSVQSQNWVIVKTPSVKVISETRRVGGVLGKAKKGAALWLREGTVTDDWTCRRAAAFCRGTVLFVKAFLAGYGAYIRFGEP